MSSFIFWREIFACPVSLIFCGSTASSANFRNNCFHIFNNLFYLYITRFLSGKLEKFLFNTDVFVKIELIERDFIHYNGDLNSVIDYLVY